MVRNATVLLVIFLVALIFSAGVRVTVIEEKGAVVDKGLKSSITNRLERILKDRLDLDPDKRPAEYGFVFHIFNFKLEKTVLKKVEFTPDEKGSYIYFKGNYYQVGWKRFYRYDYESGRFVPDKDGGYIYFSGYVWAREDKDKYVYVGRNFYRKVVKNITKKRYYLDAFVTLVDFRSSLILWQDQLSLSSDSLEELVKNINLNINKTKFYTEKPLVAFYDPTLSSLSGSVRKNFYEEERYNMYDRSYLKYLFDEMRFQDLITGGMEIGSAIKAARYLVVVKPVKEVYSVIKKTEYLTFTNNVDGGYVGKTPIHKGRFYSYDPDKGYYVDMKNGTYVKAKKSPWAREDRYISAYSFNDLFIEEVPYHHLTLSVFVMVVDGKTGVVKAGKTFTMEKELPVKKRVDRYGSENGYFKEDVYAEVYERLGKKISDFVRVYFAIETTVNDVNDDVVKIGAGKNFGVKKGYFFRVVEGGFTQGYVRVKGVGEKVSDAELVRLISRKSKVLKGMEAVEDFDYHPAWGLCVKFFVKPYSAGFIFGFSPLNLYGEKTYEVALNLYGSGDIFGGGLMGVYYLYDDKTFSIGLAGHLNYESITQDYETKELLIKGELGVVFERVIFPSIFSEGGFYIFAVPYIDNEMNFGIYIGSSLRM